MRISFERLGRLGARAALSAALALATPHGVNRAEAQAAVVCANCSTWMTQALQHAIQARQLATQIQERATQIQMYANMVQNTVAMPGMVYSDVMGQVAQIRSLMQAGTHLSLNSGFSASRLGSYTGYLGGTASSIGSMPDRYAAWSRQANDNVASLMRGLGLRQDQMRSEQAMLAGLNSRSRGASGQMQAIQAGNEYAAHAVGQMHGLQAIMLGHAQAVANTTQIEADQRALGRAVQDDFFGTPDYAMAGGRSY